MLEILKQAADRYVGTANGINSPATAASASISFSHAASSVAGSIALTSLELTVESVNALIDLYAEDSRHTATLQATKCLEKLAFVARDVLPAAARAERIAPAGALVADAALRARCEETFSNLAAFLAYKPAHV